MSRRPYVRTVETELVARPSPLRRLHDARADQPVHRSLLRAAGDRACPPGQGQAAWEGFLAAPRARSARPVPTGMPRLRRLSQRHLVRRHAEGHAADAATASRCPASTIVGGHYAAWAVVSLVVLIAAGV